LDTPSYMGATLRLSPRKRNTGWGYMRTGCWGEYLDLRGTKQQQD